MASPVVSLSAYRARRLHVGVDLAAPGSDRTVYTLHCERVELPSLIDIDGTIAELERLRSEARGRLATLPFGSLRHQWTLNEVLGFAVQIFETQKLRRVVERRMSFRLAKVGRDG